MPAPLPPGVGREADEPAVVSGSHTTPQTERSRVARAGALVLGIVAIAAKLLAIRDLLHDGRVVACVVLGLGLLSAFRYGKVLLFCALVALIVPIAAGVHPFLAAVAIVAALFVLLTALSYLTGLVLRARDARDPGFRSGGSADGDPQRQPVDHGRVGLG